MGYLHHCSAASIKLITIGPGDAFWSAFGHTAIAIDDAVYGFGYFSFDDDIIGSFIGNRMQYDLGVSDFNYEIKLAQQQNRDFSTIQLSLTVDEVNQILEYLRWHMLPENQSYRYDYFLNNCSTKVRDLLNDVFHQNLKNKSSLQEGELKSSYIDQTFPAKHQGLMNFGLALGYGWPAYTARNSWELMAFPLYLENHLLHHLIDQSNSREMLIQAELGNPIQSFVLTHWFLILYVLLWLVFLLFKPTQRMASKLWFIWHGVIGVVLLSLWVLTPHSVANWNFNVLLMMPLGLLVIQFKRMMSVIVWCWFCWLILAMYLQAWYLTPLLIPALLARNLFVKSA